MGAKVEGLDVAAVAQVPGMQPVALPDGRQILGDQAVLELRRPGMAGFGKGLLGFCDLADPGCVRFPGVDEAPLPGHHPSTHRDLACHDRRVHAPPVPALTKTVFDMTGEHAAQCAALDAPRFPHHDRVMLNETMARETLMAAGMDLVPCLNDPMYGNPMIGPDGSIMLFDHGYSPTRGRCHDLGIRPGKMILAPAQEPDLIEDHLGTDPHGLVGRVTLSKALADVTWTPGAMVRPRMSRPDLDLHGSDTGKPMRFRQITGHPRRPAQPGAA